MTVFLWICSNPSHSFSIVALSLQATVDLYMKYLGVSEAEARSLVKLSVILAREAREEYLKENPSSAMPLIAGSVGPFGSQFYDELYTYSGTYVDKVTRQVLHHICCVSSDTPLMYYHTWCCQLPW